MYEHIHVLGASGSGTSTLGVALATRLGARHLDVDDYYWEPTEPPFVRPRPVAQRQRLLDVDLARQAAWVLSGSLCGWGDRYIPRFDCVVFLRVPTALRLARLRRREEERFGDGLVPGGAMHENHRAFLAWAAEYDEGGPDMRSLARHRAWLARLACPVVSLEREMAVAEQVGRVLRLRSDGVG